MAYNKLSVLYLWFSHFQKHPVLIVAVESRDRLPYQQKVFKIS